MKKWKAWVEGLTPGQAFFVAAILLSLQVWCVHQLRVLWNLEGVLRPAETTKTGAEREKIPEFVAGGTNEDGVRYFVVLGPGAAVNEAGFTVHHLQPTTELFTGFSFDEPIDYWAVDWWYFSVRPNREGEWYRFGSGLNDPLHPVELKEWDELTASDWEQLLAEESYGKFDTTVAATRIVFQPGMGSGYSDGSGSLRTLYVVEDANADGWFDRIVVTGSFPADAVPAFVSERELAKIAAMRLPEVKIVGDVKLDSTTAVIRYFWEHASEASETTSDLPAIIR